MGLPLLLCQVATFKLCSTPKETKYCPYIPLDSCKCNNVHGVDHLTDGFAIRVSCSNINIGQLKVLKKKFLCYTKGMQRT
jgi:hypothetical protein